MSDLHRPAHPVRFVTAASLFDGHDAAINIMRRLLQAQGAEVVHLGHNRSVDEVVRAAVEEDVQGVAVSSYQGGHVEYFRYLVDRLRAEGRGDVSVYGGGGGVIVPAEIEELEAYGVRRIFSPVRRPAAGPRPHDQPPRRGVRPRPGRPTAAVAGRAARPATTGPWPGGSPASRPDPSISAAIDVAAARLDGRRPRPVLGITGTGGSGKSSLTDELIRRFRLDQEDKLSIAVLAVDPTRRRGGGALLGDRIRMNAIDAANVFFRSLATRGSGSELPDRFPLVVAACAAAGFDLVIVETPGIGQGDAAVTEIADVSLYVMTPEYGAASQLEKIDMLELADVVAINKFDRRGADDAFRQVCRQWSRDHRDAGRRPGTEPVFGTIASRFNDDGVTALFHRLKAELSTKGLVVADGCCFRPPACAPRPVHRPIVPAERHRYLAEIAASVRGYHATTARLAAEARQAQQLAAVVALGADRAASRSPPWQSWRPSSMRTATPRGGASSRSGTTCGPPWSSTIDRTGPRRRTTRSSALWRTSLSGTRIPRVALPRVTEHGELLRWLRCRAPARPLPLHRRGLPLQAGPGRTRPACSPARAMRSGPTAASTSWPRASRPPACPRRSTR